MALSRQNLRLSLTLLVLVIVIGPVVLSMGPVISILFWLSSAYCYTQAATDGLTKVSYSPVDATLDITPKTRAVLRDGDLPVHWPAADGNVQLRDESGAVLLDIAPSSVVATVHKRLWWNWLLEHPAGYLDDQSSVDGIEIEMPRKTILNGVPAWMATWAFSFLLGLLICSIGLKVGFRIE